MSLKDAERTLARATTTTEITVRFAETDAMGVVHHAAYIIWLEMGRVAWLQAVGVPYTAVVAAGHHFAVTGVHANYRASCQFGDGVRIVTRLQLLRSRQIVFGYELFHASTSALLVTATSEHICVDLAGRMAKLPATLFNELQRGVVQLAAENSAVEG